VGDINTWGGEKSTRQEWTWWEKDNQSRRRQQPQVCLLMNVVEGCRARGLERDIIEEEDCQGKAQGITAVNPAANLGPISLQNNYLLDSCIQFHTLGLVLSYNVSFSFVIPVFGISCHLSFMFCSSGDINWCCSVDPGDSASLSCCCLVLPWELKCAANWHSP